MCNSIFLGKKTIPGAEDGESFTMTVKGVYRTDEDGTRKLDVKSIDGMKVMDPEAEKSDCGCEDEPDLVDQNADDALRIFILKKKK